MFYLQISILCWGMRMACPVLFPLDTTTNGTMNARQRGVRTIFCGVPPALAMMRPKDGASVRCKVKMDTQTCGHLLFPPAQSEVCHKTLYTLPAPGATCVPTHYTSLPSKFPTAFLNVCLYSQIPVVNLSGSQTRSCRRVTSSTCTPY